jgi:hypothetical protein
VKTDLHVSASYQAWTANLYVNNVMDRRGLMSGGTGNLFSFAYFYIQPRTIGASFAKSF